MNESTTLWVVCSLDVAKLASFFISVNCKSKNLKCVKSPVDPV